MASTDQMSSKLPVYWLTNAIFVNSASFGSNSFFIMKNSECTDFHQIPAFLTQITELPTCSANKTERFSTQGKSSYLFSAASN